MRWSLRSSQDRTENSLAVALGRARAAGRAILDLTESNPTRCDLPYDAVAIRAAVADETVLRYEPAPFGTQAAREAVARELRRHGTAVSSDRVILTASTSEAYGFLFKLLCDPGGQVLVPRPGYPLFEGLARYEAVDPVGYRVAFDGAWHVDVPSLRDAVTDRTRTVVVVNPSNPTGHYLSEHDRARIVELGLPVICDEVFAAYPLDGQGDTALSITEVPTFVLGGLSKLAALPQLKLGWIALGGPDAAVDEALARLEHLADAYLSVSAPVQVAVGRLLEASTPTRAAILDRARGNIATLRAALAETSASVLPAQGGWYAVVRLPRVATEEAWCLSLLEDDGVWVQPGWLYDFEDEAYIVLSLIVRPDVFADGAARIAARVASVAPV